jgi:hypothetical protein
MTFFETKENLKRFLIAKTQKKKYKGSQSLILKLCEPLRKPLRSLR